MTNKPNEVLLPCPFCASTDVKIVTADGCHFAQCRKCEATGPTGFKRGDEDDADWNTRAQPADQQGEPFAWLIKLIDDGSIYCITQDKLRADRLIADSDYVTTPLYRHAQPATAKVDERLTEATAFVQKLCDAASGQPSVATGYLSDIMDVLQGRSKLNTPQ
ncbi:hypothetical protein [Pseudomonas viridiflava]|uniref:hypothetical protein n=1 Tax=Pseudomonas viridiflava TaxID=33069 RepID=UPI001C319450|nr:hypothetical protein [Pseudomonas viridiflava]QXG49173.1 hypothetical protein KTT57_09200 [Pseudomonas viridiflava]